MAAADADGVLADRPPGSVLADRPVGGVLANRPPGGVLADRPPGPRVPLAKAIAMSQFHATHDEWTINTSPPATVVAAAPPSTVGGMTMAAANLFFLASSPSGLGSTGLHLDRGRMPVAPARWAVPAAPTTRGCTRMPRGSNPWATDRQRRVVAGGESLRCAGVAANG
jgi:hypothetical protein